jgi:RluA family pseudouridine synthase
MGIEEKIIFEDDDYVVVNKDSGMLAIPDRYNKELPNLYDMLTEKYGKIFIVHRLDKDTSGAIIFAKTPEAHRDLSIKWEEGGVSKTYFALVTGRFDESQGNINLPIGPLKKKKGVMVIDKRNGKDAFTSYKVLEKYREYTYLEVTPKTGRTHQIRVHLAAIGHPLVVDPLYNRKEAILNLGTKKEEKIEPQNFRTKKEKDKKPKISKEKLEKIRKQAEEKSKLEPIINRLPLHAGKIKFMHYKTKEFVEIEAPMPKDMRTTLDILSLQSFFNNKDKKKL